MIQKPQATKVYLDKFINNRYFLLKHSPSFAHRSFLCHFFCFNEFNLFNLMKVIFQFWIIRFASRNHPRFFENCMETTSNINRWFWTNVQVYTLDGLKREYVRCNERFAHISNTYPLLSAIKFVSLVRSIGNVARISFVFQDDAIL